MHDYRNNLKYVLRFHIFHAKIKKKIEKEGERLMDKKKSLTPAATIGLIIVIAFMLFALCSCKFNLKIGKQVETSGDYYVTGCKDVLKVREEEDEESKVLTKLDNGEKVSLVEKGDSTYWKVFVEAEDIVGYIDHHYLIGQKDAVTEPLARYVDVQQNEPLTILDAPSANGTSLGIAQRSDEVTVLAKLDETYVYIYAADASAYGYVERNKLSENKPAVSSSATDTAGTTQTTIPEVNITLTNPQIAPAQTAPATDYLGYGNAPASYQGIYYVKVSSGYLALRNAKAYDSSNEIGEMYNGDYVEAIRTSGQYWYVYSPSLGAYGYTNSDYLVTSAPYQSATNSNTYYASVSSGYLALRNAQAYDETNEIGKISNGQEVQVVDSSTGTYWYVYVPALGQYGYVNSDYLRK